jgi:hypothetical protein
MASPREFLGGRGCNTRCHRFRRDLVGDRLPPTWAHDSRRSVVKTQHTSFSAELSWWLVVEISNPRLPGDSPRRLSPDRPLLSLSTACTTLARRSDLELSPCAEVETGRLNAYGSRIASWSTVIFSPPVLSLLSDLTLFTVNGVSLFNDVHRPRHFREHERG